MLSLTGKLMSKQSFSALVNKMVRDSKGEIGYMEAIIDICHRNQILVEDIATLVDETLKGCIEAEASELNMLKGVTTARIVGG